MKVFAFLTILVVVSLAKAQSADQQKMFEQLVSKCAAKEEATSDDIAALMNRDVPMTRSDTCLRACVMENLGAIRDGKPSVEGTAAVAQASGAEPSKIASTIEVAQECASVSDPDRCTLALKLIECTVRVATARGLDPKHLFD